MLQVSGALTAQAGCILETLDNYVAGALPLAAGVKRCCVFSHSQCWVPGLLSPEMLQHQPSLHRSCVQLAGCGGLPPCCRAIRVLGSLPAPLQSAATACRWTLGPRAAATLAATWQPTQVAAGQGATATLCLRAAAELR